MADEKYNGWSNYETWVVKLWMDNDEGSYDYWRENTEEAYNDAEKRRQFARIALADRLENDHREAMPEVTGVFADLLGRAMGRVDWHEIADALLEDFIEEEQENEETDKA